MAAFLPDLLRQALALHQGGRLAEAESVYRKILASEPRSFDALHYLGVLRAQCGDMAGACALIGKALTIRTDSSFAYFHLAGAQRPLGQRIEALANYERAAALKPDFAEAYVACAGILLDMHRNEEALVAIDRAIALAPSAEAFVVRGGALLALSRKEEALVAFDRSIGLQADCVEAHNGRGHAIFELGRPEEALAAFDRAIVLKPDFVEAHINRGNMLLELGLGEEALAALNGALTLKPDCAETYYNMGNTLTALDRQSAALAAFDGAITLKPDYAEALYNRSSVLDRLGRAQEALADSDKALALNPKLGLAAARSFYARACLCDWHDRADRVNDLARRCRAGQSVGLFVLSAFDDPELQWLAAKTKAGPAKQDLRKQPAKAHARLRIAYLSPDFHDHPVAHQVVELLERHDRSRFETYGICLQSGPESPIRQRLRKAFDHFVEMGGRSDPEIAHVLEDLQIDIAVDLGGYTDNGRTSVLAYRPVPIAVNYLGYAGTLGAEYVDYILADAQAISSDSERFFTEKVVRLPDCFLPSDTKGRGHPTPPSRAEAGLPDEAFVFCGFNSSYKITPEMFDVWMRLLRAVDGSVLWLSVGNPDARKNLRAEAAARQVSPERLIFADRVAAREHHLARLALADLFLDTLPYNAHSTASDMLWAGVPVATCMGKSFAARVAGSLLTALGLEELIARDLGAYETLALALAREPHRLADLRRKLSANRATHPLFDMARLCRHLESAYETMWNFHAKGQKPQSFSVRLSERPGAG